MMERTCRRLFFIAMIAWLDVIAVTVKNAPADQPQHCPALVLVQQDKGTGSGICISPEGLILTNAHCADKGDSAAIRFEGGTRLTAAVIQRSKNADLAILKVDSPDPLPSVPVALANPDPGEVVWSEGYPAGQYASMEGTVKRIVLQDSWTTPVDPPRMIRSQPAGNLLPPFAQNVQRAEMIWTTHKVQPGNSGGPLFCRTGEVVGIVGWIPDANETGCVSATEINKEITLGRFQVNRLQKYHRPKKLPRAIVVWQLNCKACFQLKSDYESNEQFRNFVDSHYRVEFKQDLKVPRFCKKHRLGGFPAIVCADLPSPLIGYSGPQDLIDRVLKLRNGVSAEMLQKTEFDPDCCPDTDPPLDPAPQPKEPQGLLGFEFKPRAESVYSEPERTTRDTPTAQPRRSPVPVSNDVVPAPLTPQPELVAAAPPSVPETTPVESIPQAKPSGAVLARGVFLVPKAAWIPGVVDGVVQGIEKTLDSRLVAKFNAAMQGKLIAEAVYERMEPERYAAAANKSGVDLSKGIALVILVPEKLSGTAGSLVGMAEKSLSGFQESLLKGIPIREFFERDKDDARYKNTLDALDAEYAAAAGSAGNGWLMGLVYSLMGLLGWSHRDSLGSLLGKLRPGRSESK